MTARRFHLIGVGARTVAREMANSETHPLVGAEQRADDPRRQAAVATAVALVFLLICWWMAAQWYRERLLADERARAQAQRHRLRPV